MRKLPSLPYPQLVAWLLALACAASGAQWGLRLLAGRAPLGEQAQGGLPAVERLASAATGLFGGPPAPRGPAAPRYHLWGVIGGGTRAGAALIGLDSAPAQAFAVGAEIAPGVRLVETAFGRAVLLHDGVRTTLQTPHGDEPARGAAGRVPQARGGDVQAAPGAAGGDSAAAEAARMRELSGR